MSKRADAGSFACDPCSRRRVVGRNAAPAFGEPLLVTKLLVGIHAPRQYESLAVLVVVLNSQDCGTDAFAEFGMLCRLDGHRVLPLSQPQLSECQRSVLQLL